MQMALNSFLCSTDGYTPQWKGAVVEDKQLLQNQLSDDKIFNKIEILYGMTQKKWAAKSQIVLGRGQTRVA
jgi:hypothetical protein